MLAAFLDAKPSDNGPVLQAKSRRFLESIAATIAARRDSKELSSAIVRIAEGVYGAKKPTIVNLLTLRGRQQVQVKLKFVEVARTALRDCSDRARTSRSSS